MSPSFSIPWALLSKVAPPARAHQNNHSSSEAPLPINTGQLQPREPGRDTPESRYPTQCDKGYAKGGIWGKTSGVQESIARRDFANQ